ncbi:MAG: glycosyltransferase [Anaerolineae bacterium]
MPRVSIVLPTYNGVRYIRQSLNSCLDQSFGDLEVVIVDGGSKDGTLDIVSEYTDPRVRLIPQPPDSGRLPGAINLGMRTATGEFLTWTHDDNWYEPGAIQTLVDCLEQRRDVAFVYSDYWKVDPDGNTISRFHALPPDKLSCLNCVGHCFLYRRDVYEAVGEYDPEYYLAEDYEYWLRVYRRFTMQPLSEALYYYRVHPESLTLTKGFEAQQRAAERARRKWIGPDPYRYPSRFSRRLGQVYLDQAFEAHGRGEIDARRNNLLKAIRHDPRHIANRGVRSLLGRTLLSSLQGGKSRSS